MWTVIKAQSVKKEYNVIAEFGLLVKVLYYSLLWQQFIAIMQDWSFITELYGMKLNLGHVHTRVKSYHLVNIEKSSTYRNIDTKAIKHYGTIAKQNL